MSAIHRPDSGQSVSKEWAANLCLLKRYWNSKLKTKIIPVKKR